MSEEPQSASARAPAKRRGRALRVLIVLGVIALAAIGVVQGRQWWWQRDAFTFLLRLESAEGLETGAPVRIAGVEAGRVANIDFRPGPTDPARRLPVLELRIRRAYAASLHTNLTVEVEKPLVFGEGRLEIQPGSAEARLVNEGELLDLAARGGMLERARRMMGEFFAGDEQPPDQATLRRFNLLYRKIEHLEERVDVLEAEVRELKAEKDAVHLP